MIVSNRRFWRRKGGRPASERRARPAGLGALDEPKGVSGSLLGYAVGGALALAAFAAELALLPVFQFSTFLLFYPGAFVTALIAGTAPALFNLALAGAGTMWLLTQRQPFGEPPLLALLHTAAFLAFSGAAAALAGRLRRAEAELQRSKEDLQRAQEVAHIGSWRLEMPGGPLTWSEETFRLFGLPEGATLTYADFLSYVHPDDRLSVDEAWQAALQGAPYDLEHRVVVDGAVRWVHERAALDFDASGRPLRATGTVQDVSARRKAEEDLSRLRQQERFRLALEAAAGAIIVVTGEGLIVHVNGEAERLFGRTRAELEGRSSEMLLAEPFRAGHRERREAFLRGGAQKLPGGAGRELRIVRKDGSEVPVEVALTRVIEDGSPLIVASISDITSRKAAERALEDAADRLRGMVLDLESFAYTISHDLRSPLRAIQGYAHFLYARLAPSADSDSRRMLARMEQAAVRLDVLIKDLLAFNAVGRQEVRLEPVDLDETLAHVADHYPELSRADLRVRAPLGKALAQPSLAIQVLANLLINAVKFVPRDVRPEIEVSVARRDGRVRLSVRDNGIGIAKESLPRLFKPFERLHRAEDYPGTGMGLSIVKRAVEKMGGSIEVESRPGEGSVFTVTLREA